MAAQHPESFANQFDFLFLLWSTNKGLLININILIVWNAASRKNQTINWSPVSVWLAPTPSANPQNPLYEILYA